MKKFIFIFCVGCMPLNVWAESSPYEKFLVDKNFTDKTTVTWRVVKNLNAECEKESIKRGHGGFKTPMEACSFWSKGLLGNNCLIITEKKVNYWTVGHEVRHCFQGSFH
jgi:hypothetical protein